MGEFVWEMDLFGLLISDNERESFVALIGPYLAAAIRAYVWLNDPTIPAVIVADLAASVVEVLTGERCGRALRNGPFAQAQSESAIALLTKHLTTLDSSASANA